MFLLSLKLITYIPSTSSVMIMVVVGSSITTEESLVVTVREYVSLASNEMSSSVMLNVIVAGNVTVVLTSVPDICTPSIVVSGPEVYMDKQGHFQLYLHIAMYSTITVMYIITG